MAIVTMKQLLESGVHFGHQTGRWNPRMKSFIFQKRKGIHILDLQQTIPTFTRAYNFVRDISASGKDVLFVGTKRQAASIITEQAKRCGAHYVSHRWLGGTLTNFQTIRKSIDKLEDIQKREENGETDHFTKKERSNLEHLKEKMLRNLGGIQKMTKLPGCLFIIDPKREDLSIHEARLLKIPIVALVDSNCDPTVIDYPVPANDDAIRSITLLVGKIADAVEEGRKMNEERMLREVQEAETLRLEKESAAADEENPNAEAEVIKVAEEKKEAPETESPKTTVTEITPEPKVVSPEKPEKKTSTEPKKEVKEKEKVKEEGEKTTSSTSV